MRFLLGLAVIGSALALSRKRGGSLGTFGVASGRCEFWSWVGGGSGDNWEPEKTKPRYPFSEEGWFDLVRDAQDDVRGDPDRSIGVGISCGKSLLTSTYDETMTVGWFADDGFEPKSHAHDAPSKTPLLGLGHAPEPFSWYTDEQFVDELLDRVMSASADAQYAMDMDRGPGDPKPACDEEKRATLVAIDSLNEARRMSRTSRWAGIYGRLAKPGWSYQPKDMPQVGLPTSKFIAYELDSAIQNIKESIAFYEKDCGRWGGPRP